MCQIARLTCISQNSLSYMFSPMLVPLFQIFERIAQISQSILLQDFDWKAKDAGQGEKENAGKQGRSKRHSAAPGLCTTVQPLPTETTLDLWIELPRSVLGTLASGESTEKNYVALQVVKPGLSNWWGQLQTSRTPSKEDDPGLARRVSDLKPYIIHPVAFFLVISQKPDIRAAPEVQIELCQ